MNQEVLDQTRSMSIAQALATAKMVPAQFRNSPGDCYIAVNMAHRYGMDPWMLMQEMYIINGRPMLSGKLTAAICNHNLAEPLTPVYSGEGDNRKAVITGRQEGREPQSIELTVKHAKTTNEQWIKNPDQMLFYAGSRMWARRYTPAAILGIVFDDEVDDAPHLAPEIPKDLPKIQAPEQHEIINPQTGQVTDKPVEIVVGVSWRDWGNKLIYACRQTASIEEIDQWLMLNQNTLLRMKDQKNETFLTVQGAIDARKQELVGT
jgi:hypothetical protein